ncbi:MAG: hypothetical protein RL596_1577 [Bacteroidota bacterium]|jgi:hypothetical protein
MRPNLLIIILILIASYACLTKKPKNEQLDKAFTQKTYRVDSLFTSKIKLNEISVCSTTITDLKQKGHAPVLMPHEQIDSFIKDINWQEGDYYYDNTKKLLFCTYNQTELISTIFIKDNFKGVLRDLPIEDFSKLRVDTITNHFKDLKWTTTGASDYWIYGNDSINFYIKIDTSIPRFPLNEKFYEDKHPTLAKIQFLCNKVYGNEYAKFDTVMQKPLYAPFNDTHLNYYLLRRKPGIGTTLTEIFSAGKKTNMEEIRIGKWVTYNPDHTIKSVEYYNNGKVTPAKK